MPEPAPVTTRPSQTRMLRSVALDGARLLFDPAAGLNVRIDGPSTRALVRTAPRVVMFGITNHCNLRCAFCSRDAGATSLWDESSAFTMLAELAERGVLEVAFGGGEPLVFRGFDALVERLARETPLALHLTTNGELLTGERLARLRPLLGEIRLSIYDDTAWPARVSSLARAGGSFGVNLLVTKDRVPLLAGTLDRLERLGCPDVALLRYVGPDASSQLDPDDERRVAVLVAASRMRVRLSVCFGAHLGELPRLFDGDRGDCGAGREFVVIDANRTMKRCSFAGPGMPVASADDVLRVYHDERSSLASPVALGGCARAESRGTGPAIEDAVRVWQGYSGNNSGDCVLVGRFESEDEATRFVEALRPGFEPGEEYSDAWKQVLVEAGVTPEAREFAPDALVAVGSSVLAHTRMAVEDDFPSLRTLVWRRGGRIVLNAIHEHEPVLLVAGLGFRDAQTLEAAEVALSLTDVPVGSYLRRGLSLLGTGQMGGGLPTDPQSLTDTARELGVVAARTGAELSAELVVHPDAPKLAAILAARPADADTEYLFMRFDDLDRADAFAASAEGRLAKGHRWLIAAAGSARHDGARAHARGATAQIIPGDVVVFEAMFYREGRADELDAAALDAELRTELGPDATVALDSKWKAAVGTVTTRRPLNVLPALAAFAEGRGLALFLEARAPNPLPNAFARIDVDLARLRASRR